MTAIKTTLTLSDLDRRWMDELVSNGEFLSNSEYIRSLIRKDKESRAEIEMIRARLEKAETSGFTTQTPEEILAEIKEELRRDGVLSSN